VWVGFDEKKTLGEKETGAQAALPIWIEFMKVAIADKKDEQFPEPPPEVLAAGKRKIEKNAAHGSDGESH
jgi:penicillin-binding protein 1A